MQLPNATVAHIGVAVSNLDDALAFYRDVLGVTPARTGAQDGAEIVSLPLGEVDVELLHPVTTDGPVARFLARRGPGVHHVCYRVADLEQALDACRTHGYRLVDHQPRLGDGGHRIAFVHPKSTAGVLIELTE